MADIDATDTTGTSPETEGTEASPESKDTDYAALVASARKRQAGAEAARQAAETKYAAAEQELLAYRAKNQTDAQKDLSELARLQEQLKSAEARASEAEAKAEARILDARFPNARKELPEITDEVRLAKYEAMLADPGDPEPPTPRGVNGPRTGQKEPAKELTSADILAHLATLTPDW
jgi:multidrug efflux pump subunit AcrA (membrane-fusion protein)